MRTFQPVTPPKDMDPRVYKVLKRQNDYLHQLSAGMGKITDGNVPDQSGTTIIEAPVISDHGALDGLAPIVTGTTTLDYNDDHTQYALLAGRTAGQYLYGSRQASSSTWQNVGTFTNAFKSSTSDIITPWAWTSTTTNNAPVGTGILLVLSTGQTTGIGSGETSLHVTMADSGSNTWTKKKEYSHDSGILVTTVSVWYCLVTTALTGGTSTVTATFDSDKLRASIESYSWNLGAGASISVVDSAVAGSTAVNIPPSATATATGETLYFRALAIDNYQGTAGGFNTLLFTPTGSFTPLTTDHTGSTCVHVGFSDDGFCSRGEFRVLSEGATSQPSIDVGDQYNIASIMLAIQLTLGTPGLLNLSSIKATGAANILMSGSTIYANMDFLYFRNAGGTTNLSYIRGSDGAFVGPVVLAPKEKLLNTNLFDDVAAGAAVQGDVMVGNATPAWAALPISGTSGSVLYSDGTDAAWSDFTTLGDATYLRLDASNDPLTGDLLSNKSIACDVSTDNSGSISVYDNLTNPPFPKQTIATLGVGIGTAVFTASTVAVATPQTGSITGTANQGSANLLLSATDAAAFNSQLAIVVNPGLEISFNSKDATPIVFYTDDVERFRIDEFGGNLIIESAGVDKLISKSTTTAPTVSNDTTELYKVGSRWVDTTNQRDWIATDVTAGAAVWVETTGAGAGVTRAYVPAGVTTTIPDRHQIAVSGVYEIDATGLLTIDNGGKLVILEEAA